MFEPAIAPVRPRVASPVTADSVLLEDEVLTFAEQRQSGVILLLGGRGSGKTTAVRHLAAVLPRGHRIALLDTDDNQSMPQVADGGITISTRRVSPGGSFLAELRLQPWGRDEWIEYLLATHPDDCGSVISRASDGDFLEGSPRWWRIVLDVLADDSSLPDVEAAVEQHLRSILTSDELRQCAADFCLSIIHSPEVSKEALQEMRRAGLPPEQEAVIYHRPICVRLAGEAVVRQLAPANSPRSCTAGCLAKSQNGPGTQSLTTKRC